MSTVVRDPYFDVMPAFFGLSFEALQAALDPEAWRRFEEGRCLETTWFETCFRDRRRIDGPGLVRALTAAYQFMPGMEMLLEQLVVAGFELHALSNYPLWYRGIEDRLGLSRFIKWSFVSCETGLRKPDPRAYKVAAATLGVSAEVCLLVDDQQVNVEAAWSVGMAAVRFTDAAALQATLLG